ncbi:MAG: hypothetical protein RH982_14275 [Parvibaculum sp.]
MSPIAKAALIAELKSRIAGHAPADGGRHAVMPLGTAAIDEALPEGGLKLGALHEIAAATYGDMGAATGFLAALTALVHERSSLPVLWCEAGHSPFDMGRLYGPGLAAFGLDPARLVLVSPPRDNDCLWVMEEALRSHAFAAVVGEIEASSPSLDLTATRRLQLAAEAAEMPVLLFTGYAKKAMGTASVAVSRWHVTAAPSAHVPYADERENLPGLPCWDVSLVRSRGGQPGQWLLEWNSAVRSFSVVASARKVRRPALYSGTEIVTPLRQTA